MNWNGKVLGIGGGGFAGNLTLNAAANGLSRGYAVIPERHGAREHRGRSIRRSRSQRRASRTSRRSSTSVIARRTSPPTWASASSPAITARAPQHAYWQGCSTGGRQGLAEIQRYPADYDGVIAGAPVYTPLVYSNAILRVQAFHKKPESNLLPEHVRSSRNTCLPRADAKDGVA
jgi:feruloyl esterase